jgi:hypothetical protein
MSWRGINGLTAAWDVVADGIIATSCEAEDCCALFGDFHGAS